MAQWQPGQSGNPSGRPKDTAAMRAVKEAAQAHSLAALEVIVAALEDEDAKIRLKAAELLLDRGIGKPTQPISGDEDFGPVKLSWIRTTT